MMTELENQLSGTEFTRLQDLIVQECCKCHMLFAMTVSFKKHRKKDKKNFYCPAGHPQYFPQETEEQRLERELRYTEGRLHNAVQQNETLRASRAAIKGHLTRNKRRMSAGMCPCCRRTFGQLAEHMKNEHPEYVEEQKL